MTRRLAAFVVVAMALAGLMLVPSQALAKGKPTHVVCLVDNQIELINIAAWGGTGGAVGYCFSLFGHPVGVTTIDE